MSVQPAYCELRYGAWLVRYEFDLFDDAARHPRRDAGLSLPLQQGLFDTTRVHARALLDFFFPRTTNGRDTRHDRDVKAEHYIPNWVAPFASVAGRDITTLRRQLDQLVVHISYDRGEHMESMDKPYWPIEEMANDLGVLLDTFLDSLDDDHRRWFDRREAEPWRRYWRDCPHHGGRCPDAATTICDSSS